VLLITNIIHTEQPAKEIITEQPAKETTTEQPAKEIITEQPAKETTTEQPKQHGSAFIILFVLLGVSQVASIFLVMPLRQNLQHVSKQIERITTVREKTYDGIIELEKSFAVFQDSLNRKDAEIDRLRKGYDTAVYEKFLKKFIKFYVELKKKLTHQRTKRMLPFSMIC
jgi:uncharacterized membrane protein